MAMRTVIKLVLLGALAWLAYILFSRMNAERIAETSDPTKIIMYFISMIALAIVAGAILATTVIPALGERLGDVFYSSGEKIQKDPHSDAVAKMARGDFEGAAESYEAIAHKNPDDLHALSEAARLRCERLGDCEGAARLLEQGLERDLSLDDSAFLVSRLVDVYWNYYRDAQSSIALLQQIIEKMPDTRHATNAYHRIRQIESASGELPPQTSVMSDPESASPPDDRERYPT
jgi:tetratricopeptide (TPR) repeat protein